QERPGQGAWEARRRVEVQVATGLRRRFDLLDGPAGAGLGLATHRRGGEAVHDGVVRRMDGDEVTLEMGRQLGDDEAMRGERSLHLVTIGLTRGRLLEVEQPRVPGRDLDTGKPERRGPARHAGERVERRGVAGELREKDRGPPDRLHRYLHGRT